MKKKTDPRKAIKKLIPKAGLALKNEFYLESSWIVSDIIESRLKSILERVEGNDSASGYNLEKSVKRVKYLVMKGNHPVLAKEIGIPLVDAIRSWKNHRNRILKDMAGKHITRQRFAVLAQEGIVLMQELNGAYKKFKSSLRAPVKPVLLPEELKPEDHEQA